VWKKYLIAFALGACLGAAIVGAIVYRSGAIGAGQIREQLDRTQYFNRQLTDQLIQRDYTIGRLEQSNSELKKSIADRQKTIDAARRELESSKSSIDKIRALLLIIKNN
jgi:uncharacterized protein HemX